MVFPSTSIHDTAYYWNELRKCLKLYVELKKVCPSLDSLNIGGGFPIKNSLAFEYDYQYIVKRYDYFKDGRKHLWAKLNIDFHSRGDILVSLKFHSDQSDIRYISKRFFHCNGGKGTIDSHNTHWEHVLYLSDPGHLDELKEADRVITETICYAGPDEQTCDQH